MVTKHMVNTCRPPFCNLFRWFAVKCSHLKPPQPISSQMEPCVLVSYRVQHDSRALNHESCIIQCVMKRNRKWNMIMIIELNGRSCVCVWTCTHHTTVCTNSCIMPSESACDVMTSGFSGIDRCRILAFHRIWPLFRLISVYRHWWVCQWFNADWAPWKTV